MLSARCALMGALCLCAPSATFAGFTPINPPVGEDTHREILSFIYGGNFQPTGAHNLDFTNGQITAVRIDDFPDPQPGRAPLFEPLNIIGENGSDDQTWFADYRVASAEAKFAVYDQNFGYFAGPAGGSYTMLFDQTGWGYQVQGDADLTRLAGQILRWGRGGEGRILSSKPSDNADGRDHMVTYRIEFNQIPSLDQPPQPQFQLTTWLLFWEDKFEGEQLADFDFNDLVVEVKALPIPEPATISGLLLGGAAMGLTRSRRRK
ncbi:PEP-CTERM sorting domain-containing protein [Fontivita pretiosa]|uniref:PEP-CTERM sorting domain-containing protein n=1 Tax=Fontivita pretiosa TaxID=2989684 RepID=UPI003D17D5B4